MAGVDDLGFQINVDASGATRGANEFTAAAGRIAEATRAIARATQGTKAAILQNAIGGRGGAEYRTVMKQIEAYKGLIKVTRELTAATRELEGVDTKKAAENISSAVKAMAQAVKTTDYLGSPQLDKVRDMVEMYSRLANAARDLARANKELYASQAKVNAGAARSPQGTATTDRERQAAIDRYQYRARTARFDQLSSGATGLDVSRAVREETAAYKDLVEAIGKAAAAEEKRAVSAGISRDIADIKKREADETRRLAEAEREARAISERARTFLADDARATQNTINTNNRYIEALESTRFAAQDLRNHLMLLATGMGGLAAASIAAAASQERAFADVVRTTQLAADSDVLSKLSDTYHELSTQISTSYEDLSAIGALGAQMGIGAEKLGDFTHAVAGFTTITGTSLDSATEAFGRFFEMVDNAGVEADRSSERYMNFASQVAELGAKSVATENEILTMANSIAATAASAGVGQDAILAYATAMASLGIKQEWARGSLQRIFGSINDAVAEAGEGLDKFAAVLGMTTTEAENLWRTDPSAFFNQLLTSLNNVTDSVERWTIIKNLGFKNTRDIQMLQRLSLNIDLVNQSFQNSAEAARNTDFLNNSLGTLNATLTETIARWKNSLANLSASVGENFLSPVKLLLKALITIQNALSHLGDNSFGRIFLAAAGGLLIFGSLVAVSKVLQAVLLNISASYITMRKNMIEAGLSGSLSWANTIRLIKQANAALNENIGLLGVQNSMQKSFNLKDVVQGAANSLRNMAASAKNAVAATGVLGAAMNGLRAAAAGIAGLGPVGWIGIAATAIPLVIGLYHEWTNSAEEAADASIQAGLDAFGGAEPLAKAILQDSKEAAEGTQKSFGQLRVAVTDSSGAVRSGADALYYWVDASGNLIQATEAQAKAMGLSTLAVGEHTAALYRDALANSEAFKSLSTNDFQWLKDAGFDWKEWARIQASEGKAGIDLYIDMLIAELQSKGQDLYNQFYKKDSSVPANMTRIFGFDPGQWTNGMEETYNQIESQIEALQKLKESQGDIANTASTALASQQALSDVTAGLTGNSQDAADAQGDLADATADASEEAKTAGQAWDEYKQAIDSIITASFAFIDAEAGMYASLDALNQSLIDNGTSFNTYSEAGRANMKALEDYLKATAQYAAQTAESIGLSGQAAQQYIAEYVLTAVDDLKAQGFDTSWVETSMDRISGALGTTISGPTLDTSAMDAGLQDAVNNANQAAALIQQILAGVGITTSSKPGSVTVHRGGGARSSGRGKGGSGFVKKAYGGVVGSGGGGAQAANARAMRMLARGNYDFNRGRYQFAPKDTSTRGGGGGGGHSGGGGGGGGGRDHDYTPRSTSPRTTRKEKTPEEIFEDFLSRLDKAMNNALNKFWQSQDAQDKYHAQLNSLRKTIEDANKSIKDLDKDIWDLNNTLAEKENDLANQRYFQSVARKYGDTSRVRDIQVDINKTTKEISDTRQSITDKEKEIVKTKEGMFALQGYTEAAISNRAALKSLQSAMVEMISAYAASGASTEQLTTYAQQLKSEFIAQATQLGFNQAEVIGLSGGFDHLTSTINAVPRVVDVEVSDNGSASDTGSRITSAATNGGTGYTAPITARADTREAMEEVRKLAKDETKNITVRIVSQVVYRLSGGILGSYAHGGRVSGYAGGGAPGAGRRGNWDSDDLLGITRGGGLVGIQSGEYVMPRRSVDKYGPGMMESIRAGQFRPEVKVNPSAAMQGPITINPNQIHQLARAVSTVLELDGRQVGAAVNNVNARSGRRGTY